VIASHAALDPIGAASGLATSAPVSGLTEV
jgi:hypothetical protein